MKSIIPKFAAILIVAGFVTWCCTVYPPQIGLARPEPEPSDNVPKNEPPAERQARTAERVRFRHLLESTPVIVDGAEFVALADAEWIAYNPPSGFDRVEIQLRIVNRTDKKLLFPTFDTFGILIKTSDGKSIEEGGGRIHSLRGNMPVLILPGASYCLSREARIYWDWPANPGWRMFEYLDGTGTCSNYGPLPSGKYRLSFWFESRPEKYLEPIDGIRVWNGKAVTQDVIFDILDR